ncbi:MAG: peptidase S26 [Candidatus Bathyarchaeota archaeon B24]|nr:MAG: peptidase S26 [Candidatus Bathyarchaeota archaeon B24]
MVDAGLTTGFGKSPYTHTPIGILVNSFYITSMLLGMEFSRAYLLSKTRKPTQAIILATLLYTFIQIPLAKLLTLTEPTPLEVVEFTGSQLLTGLASNLLASTLALLGGPLASLAYRAPIEAFWWFSPILPDLTWGWKTLIGVMPPIVGFITLIHQATPMELRKLGIKPERMGGLRAIKRERREALWTVAMCTAIILTVWFSTGLLGLFPTVAISGSMRPTLEVGDIAIIVKTPVEKIKPGDIIQYATPDGMVLHRVVDIRDGYFITKGDACSTPDPEPVHPLNVRGKLVAVIPKLGWASIYVKEAIGTLWSLITTNNLTLYGTVSAATATAALAFYKTRRGRRWKRRRWVR